MGDGEGVDGGRIEVEGGRVEVEGRRLMVEGRKGNRLKVRGERLITWIVAFVNSLSKKYAEKEMTSFKKMLSLRKLNQGQQLANG